MYIYFNYNFMNIDRKYCVKPSTYSKKSSYKLKKIKNCYHYFTNEDIKALGVKQLVQSCRTSRWLCQDLEQMFSDFKARAFSSETILSLKIRMVRCVTWGWPRNTQWRCHCSHFRFPRISHLLRSECKRLFTSGLMNKACLKAEEIFWEVYGPWGWAKLCLSQTKQSKRMRKKNRFSER